ncbi:similar to Saccharomyces cerevisiae YLR335W NUP2 Nucleoporin involved in nucleocytoplasmic transport [Maudiozyma saulgeensis]|uniref:Similar to Saccharomyces cerevisiae YLR335W NUP2 Nucleoporin involved in nucleocytoplasmic transport n=1 Tax=Maudiozyma saulgeensis TaxID=1789683 RepID=A0A1X7RAK6_9SACH|nr:similar to Saccharomyces cerevisiae YLR335W NUP2 Nucleoporin involved in nucleocytoplasmic transport [Kazachstania saulgeensis]
MSKRLADDQITREAFEDNVSDDESSSQIPKTINASAEVMSKRKIAMPKKKMSFANKTNASVSEASFANAFNFAKKPVSNNNNEKGAKLKALNLQFSKKISESVSIDPFVNLSTLFGKYETYVNSINGVTSTSIANTVPIITEKPSIPEKHAVTLPSIGIQFNKKEPESEESSSSDEEVETKVEGPSFTISSNPIKSDSVFSFNKKKVEKPKDDSDSESDIEIKGPEFKISGTVKSDIFKFNGNVAASDSAKPTFSLSNNNAATASSKDSISETKEDKKALPSFNFGANVAPTSDEKTENTGAKLSFGFGADSTKKPANEAFTFGTNNVSTQPNGSNIFGNQTKKNDQTNTTNTTSFTFGSKPASIEDTKDSTNKPSFMFGSKPTSTENTETNTPSFSFGAKVSTTDTNEPAKENPTKPVFNFGVTPVTENSTKPSFTFGAKDSTDTKNDTDAAKPTFQFGAKNSEQTKLSFGPTASTEAETTITNENIKPKFDFSAKSTQPESVDDVLKSDSAIKAPSFSFGTSNTTTTPSFSFGKPAQPNPFAPSTSSTTTANNTVPSGGFKFSLPFEQNKTPEEKKTTDEPVQLTTETPKNTADDENSSSLKTGEGEKEGSDSVVSMQNGEEDETSIFSQRAKLMVFNSETKAYDSRGVGEMKVLQKKDEKSKARLLCRSDGMGNVLLNTNIVKSFQYVPLTADNENLVKTPVVDAEGKLITYIVKFKMKADGRAFMKAISDCQKDLD